MTNEKEPLAPAPMGQVQRPVRPAAWALAKDGSPYMLMYERDNRSDVYSWAPLYDQAALAAAVAAERERWRTAAAPALEWMEGAWYRIDGEWGPSGKTLDQECADGDEPVIAALRALLRA